MGINRVQQQTARSPQSSNNEGKQSPKPRSEIEDGPCHFLKLTHQNSATEETGPSRSVLISCASDIDELLQALTAFDVSGARETR